MTVKASLIFGKRFTVLKTVNHFLKLNSWSLHACLISHCQNPAIIGRRNPGGAGFRQHPAGILTTPGSGNFLPPSPDAGGPDSGRNWPESGHGQKPAESDRNPAGSDRIRQDLTKMAGIQPDLDGIGH
jgi:hypothetical protein